MQLAAPSRCPAAFKRPPSRRRQRAASARRPASSNSDGGGGGGEVVSMLEPALLWRQVAATACAGAVLGPLLDGQHSSHDVLHYAHPTWLLHLDAGALHWSLETCWWVPLLFGLAGVLIGVGYPLLDEIVGARSGAAAAAPPAPPQPPSWPAVYACIALFVAQYAASGALEAPLLHLRLPLVQAPALATGLAASGLAIWAGFDRTPAGLVISAVTAVGGPLLEVGLINGPHLYVYSHPEIWGVPGWIAWVYFAGGPAVGLLGRRVAADLRRQLGSGPQQVQ